MSVKQPNVKSSAWLSELPVRSDVGLRGCSCAPLKQWLMVVSNDPSLHLGLITPGTQTDRQTDQNLFHFLGRFYYHQRHVLCPGYVRLVQKESPTLWFSFTFRREGHYFSAVCLECTLSTYLSTQRNLRFFTLPPIKDTALWPASRHWSRTIALLNFKNWRGWGWEKNHYMVCSFLHHFLWRSDRDLHLNKRKEVWHLLHYWRIYGFG